MSAGRPMIQSTQVNAVELNPGDTLLLGEGVAAGAISTVGAGILTGAALASGIITRTGPVGAYTDTTDSAQNIITALAGNGYAVDSLPGTSWRMRYINTVAEAMTLAAGTGVVLNTTGSGVLNVAASTVREWLMHILNSTATTTQNAVVTNNSKVVTWVLPGNRSSRVLGPNGPGDITTGQLVAGAGIAAATTVAGITLGQGGSIGIILSANATADSGSLGTVLTFSPRVSITGIGGGFAL